MGADLPDARVRPVSLISAVVGLADKSLLLCRCQRLLMCECVARVLLLLYGPASEPARRWRSHRLVNHHTCEHVSITTY